MSARPLSPTQRGWRWARRHRKPLTLAGLTLTLGLIIGLAASAAYVWRQKEKTEQLYTQLLDALSHFGEAEKGFRNLPNAFETYLPLAIYHKELLCHLADEPNASFQLRREAAEACLRVLSTMERRGETKNREALLRETCDRFEALAHDDPSKPEYRFSLARSKALRMTSSELSASESTKLAREALALMKTLQDEDPENAEYFNDVSRICRWIARDHASRGEHRERLAILQQGLAVDQLLAKNFPEGHPLSYIRLADTWFSISQAQMALGNLDAAEHALRRSVANDDILARKMSNPPNNRSSTVRLRSYLGQFLVARGKLDEARGELLRGIADLKSMAMAYPEQGAWLRDGAQCEMTLGQIAYLEGREDDARRHFLKVLETRLAPQHDSRRSQGVRMPLPSLYVVPPEDSTEAPPPADESQQIDQGLAMLRANDLAGSLNHFTRFLTNRPLVSDLAVQARFCQALALAKLGRTDEAASILDEADRLDLLRFTDNAESRVRREEVRRLLKPRP